MEDIFIGVDVGGMSIKGGLVKRDGSICFKNRRKTDASKGVNFFMNDIVDLLYENIDYAKNHSLRIKGIGFGIPGVVNSKEGIIDYACNLYMEHVNIKQKLAFLDFPIYLSNDANVACLAETKFGAARNYDDVVLLTLGTGIGGGVVINKKLYEGYEGKGVELGHTVLVVDGNQCACGRKGCFETCASATALLRYTKEEMNKNKESSMWSFCNNDIENIDGTTSFECAKKGDESANNVIDKYVKYLGEGILNMLNIFRPQVLLIGGGISNQGEFLVNKLNKYCEERNYGYKNCPIVEIKIAELKNDAGIIGAGALVMDKIRQEIFN